MAPFKSTGGISVGKLLGVFRDRDLSLNSSVRTNRTLPFIGASGGNIADGIEPGNGYVYHTFGSPGTFTIPQGTGTFEVLIVAGGGGSSASISGGGAGAGGIIHSTGYSLSAGSYSVSVGDGGTAGPPSPSEVGTPGGDSIFHLLTAKGGGANGSYPGTVDSQQGGSGAGGGGNVPTWPGGARPSPFYSGKSATQPSYPQPASVPGSYNQYGSSGGTGGGAPPNAFMGGGGGGAGGSGGSAPYPTPTSTSINGGPGQPFPAFAYPLCFPAPYLPGLPSPGNPIAGRTTPSTSDHYGGGGGGGRHLAGGNSSQGQPTNGGQGGGGRGGDGISINSQGGVNYLGGGAGDGNGYDLGTAGGKGVVIIRYLT